MTGPAGRQRLTERDIENVMGKGGPRRDELVIGLLGLQGLRPRQVEWLRLGDVNVREGLLHVTRPQVSDPLAWPRPEGSTHAFYLASALERALRGYVRYDRSAPREPHEPLLFSKPGSARAITPEQVNHVVRKVSREVRGWLGFEFTVADLRWSCACNLVERGVPLDDVTDALGHENESVTRRFIERGFE